MNVKWWQHLCISAYWGPRAASAAEAAELIRSFGARLVALDPLFGNLRGLRAAGAELLGRALEKGEPTEEEADRIFAQLETRTFFLENVSTAELAAELASQAPPQNPGRFALEFTARPSGASYSAFVGEEHPASEPTPNRVGVEIPFDNPRASDTDFAVSILDASIETWKPRASGIYGVWYDLEHGSKSRSAYWLHWRAPGITKETWKDARGNPVSDCWPAGTPDTTRPHLGGTLDIYPKHRPDLLARYVAEGRPPS